VLDLDGAAAERGADASSLTSEKHWPARIVVGQHNRSVVRHDCVQPDALEILIADQARAVHLRRRLHAPMIASARNHLNEPQIPAGPTRGNSTIQAWFLSDSASFGSAIGRQASRICRK
jgi:hypothetical protein